MTNDIKISREQLERWEVMLDSPAKRQELLDELRALLAAPVVEHQEPFAYSFRFAGCVTAAGPDSWRDELDREKPAQFLFDDGRVKNFQPLYTSPPTPVADELVRLLTRARIYARGEFRDEIDACLAGKTAPVAVDERAKFEAWYLAEYFEGDKDCGLEWLSTEPCGSYRYERPATQWKVWQARACLGKIEELNQSYYILKTEEFEQMSKTIKENPMIKNRALQDLINRKPGWS